MLEKMARRACLKGICYELLFFWLNHFSLDGLFGLTGRDGLCISLAFTFLSNSGCFGYKRMGYNCNWLFDVPQSLLLAFIRYGI
jgi:hypothetical protein